jgi:hypothetical protein
VPKQKITAAEKQKEIKFARQTRKSRHRKIQNVSDQLELTKSAPLLVGNNQ